MPDEQGAGASTTTTDVAEGQQAEAGATATQTTTQEQPAPKPDSANKLIKDFAAQRGVTVEQLLDQFKGFEDANKSEMEKLAGERDTYKTQAETLMQRYREVNARVALQDAVSAMSNVYDPSTVVDLALPLLEYDGDGTPTNIEDALNTLKERRPKLFPAAAGSGDGGKGGATSTTGINDLFRQLANQAS